MGENCSDNEQVDGCESHGITHVCVTIAHRILRCEGITATVIAKAEARAISTFAIAPSDDTATTVVLGENSKNLHVKTC